MLARAGRFDLLAKLPSETVLLYWEYNSQEECLGRVVYKGRVLVNRSWLGKVHSFRDFIEAPRLFSGFIEDEFQELPEAFQKPAILPLLEPMQKTGLTVWGASSLGYSPCGTLLSDTDRFNSNMRMWRESDVKGMVITRWASNNSLDVAHGPASLRDFPLVMASELMWNGSLDRNQIADRYSCSFGKGTEQLAGLLDIMVYSENEQFFNWAEHVVPELAAMETQIDSRLLWLFNKYKVAMEAELLIRQIRSLMRNQVGHLTVNEFGKMLIQKLPEVKDNLRTCFKDEFPPDMLEEWLRYLFESYDAMFAGLKLMLENKKQG
jgi:hypothetical protein